MLLPVTLLLIVLGNPTWTVDDDGPADFADLPPAVAAAAPGDTLLVEPGAYSAFDLDKPLTILGRTGGPRPFVWGESHVVGAASFTLAGLELQELLVSDVPGRACIDDCAIGHLGDDDIGINASFALTRCAQAMVTRTIAQGKSGNWSSWESPGLELYQSEVAITDGEIIGGPGGDSGQMSGFPGALGLLVAEGSHVVLAGTSVRGGAGGPCVPIGGYSFGGDGVLAEEGATVVIRGSSWDEIAGGVPCGLGSPGWPLLGGGTIVVSGVTVSEPFNVGRGVIEPDPPEPYLSLVGGSAPGEKRQLQLYGPPGARALVALSILPDLQALPGVAGLVWLHLDQLFGLQALQAAGQDAAAAIAWRLPEDPALAGLAIPVQAFLKPGPGLLATNPSSVIVRF